jgi:acyl-coenzyme A thioesterase PaaI-like protein
LDSRSHNDSTAQASTHRQPNSQGCFICGLENAIGLKMVFEEDHETRQVSAHLTISDQYRSYPGVVHGGIVATILDETSGRAIMLETGDNDAFFATARMSIRYRKPTPTNTPLVAIGWVEQLSSSRAKVKGKLVLQDGGDASIQTVLAECESLVVKPNADFLSGWEEEVPYWRVYDDGELAQYR